MLMLAALCVPARDMCSKRADGSVLQWRHLVHERLCCVPHVRPRVLCWGAVAPRAPHVRSRAGVAVVVRVRKGGVGAGRHICSSRPGESGQITVALETLISGM